MLGLYKVVREFFLGQHDEHLVFLEVRAEGSGDSVEVGLDKAATVACSPGHTKRVLFFIYKAFHFSFCFPSQIKK